VAIEGSASGQPAAPAPGRGPPQPSRRATRREQLGRFVRAVRESDLATADEVILRLSRSRRWRASLAECVGAVPMFFAGILILFTNW